MSKAKAREVTGDFDELATWSVAFGLEGSPKLVAYQQKRIKELAAELKLKPVAAKAGLTEAMSQALGRPWYAPDLSFGFYTTFSRVEELSALTELGLKGIGKPAQMVIPVKRGASVFVSYDVLDARDGAAAAVKELLPKLSDAGAFFPNPTGSLATHIFRKQATYAKMLAELKRIIDPDDVLNSGQVVEV